MSESYVDLWSLNPTQTSMQAVRTVAADHDQNYSASMTTEDSAFRAVTDLQLELEDQGVVLPSRIRPDKLCMLFDMGTASDWEKGSLVSDLAFQAYIPDVTDDQFVRCSCQVDGHQVVLLCPGQSDKHLLIKTPFGTVCCLKIKPDTCVDKIANNLKEIGSKNEERIRHISGDLLYNAFRVPQPSVRAKDLELVKSAMLLCDKQQVSAADLLKLPPWSVVEIVVSVPLTWHVYHRYKLCYDKRYVLLASTTDILTDIKQHFLTLYTSVETAAEHDVTSLWFSQEDQLISPELLKETVDRIKKYSNNVRELVQQCSEKGKVLCVSLDSGKGHLYIDNVFVHFQPPDAVSVYVRADANPGDAGELLKVSPRITVQDLRKEVAKVVRTKEESIKLLVGGKKLTSRIDLLQALEVPLCQIKVMPKEKITLFVRVMPCPGDEEYTSREITVHAYSYDTIQAVKALVFKQTGIDTHPVDVYFVEKYLSEDVSLSEHRIRDRDTLEARVFPKRRRVSVRMPDRCWHDLLVDDCSAVTVKDIKNMSLPCEGDLAGSSLLTAIASDRVVCDSESLEDLHFGLSASVLKIVLVHTETVCFSAATTHKRNFIICKSTEGAEFQQFKVMYNEEELFYGQEVNNKDRTTLAEKRRQSPSTLVLFKGVQIIPHQSSPQATALHLLKRDDRVSQMYTTQVSDSATVNQESVERGVQNAERRETTPDEAGQSFGAQRTPALEEATEDADNVFNDASSLPDGQGLQQNQSTANEDRSQSCPPGPRPSKLVSDSQLSKLSGSDSSFHPDRKLSITTTINKNLRENWDGTWSMETMTHSTTRMTPDLALQEVTSLAAATASLAGHPRNQYQNPTSQILAVSDSTFKNIKESCIRHLAEQLHQNGGWMIIRELGITPDVIESARHDHAHNLKEQFYFCLTSWCRKEGSMATMERLKAALEKGCRRDLASTMDEMEAESTMSAPSSDLNSSLESIH